jgi:hypothetical protein
LFVAGQLEIPLYEDEYVHFRDVLLAMTREMVKGVSASLPHIYTQAEELTVSSCPSGQLTGDEGTITDMPGDQDSAAGGTVGKRRLEFCAHEFFGARRIQRQVAEWLRIKRQLEKKYMEEYKNKIKKPSGRPKKQRDARVFTIG